MYIYKYISVVGEMKIGNIVPRAGTKPTFLAFQANVYHIGSMMSPLFSCIPVYAAQRSVQTTTLVPLEL